MLLPPCFTVGMSFCCWNAGLFFLNCPENIFPVALWNIQVVFTKHMRHQYLFLEATLSQTPFLVSVCVFYDSGHMNKQFCSVQRFLEVFCYCCFLRVIFAGERINDTECCCRQGLGLMTSQVFSNFMIAFSSFEHFNKVYLSIKAWVTLANPFRGERRFVLK